MILASSSPYRRELLQRLGLKFSSESPNIDETAHPGESPEQLVARLAEAKARAVASNHPKNLIIASDQVALLNSRILGKPGNHERAVEQLREASGQRVQFFTSLALLNSESNKLQLEVIPFSVYFRHLTPQQIERYLRHERPYNCAGSFKSEGLGIALFEKLEGDDPNTLIGLPLICLINMLKREGIEPI